MDPADDQHLDDIVNMPSTAAALTPLSPILGRWRTSGTVFDQDGNRHSDVVGTDSYWMLPDGHWIAHDVDVTIDGHRTVAHELIGGMHPDGGWVMYAFDRSTHPGVMRLSLPESDLLLLEAEGVRSWFRFRAGPDHMTTRWERFRGTRWSLWMSMRFDRID